MTEDYDPREYCQVAFEEVFNLCSEPEDAFRQVAMFMGFTQHDIDNVFPIDDNYLDILGNDLSESSCFDIQQARAWVLSRAWQLHKDENNEVIISIQDAWKEFNNRCMEMV